MPAETEPAPPLAPQPPLLRRSRRAILVTLFVTTAVVAAVAVVPLVVGSSWSLIAHYECAPGTIVATEDLWTPVVLVNSPYGGFANGTGKYPTATGWWSESLGPRNGSAFAALQLDTWSIAPSVRVLVAGPGPNAVCAGFVATETLGGMYENVALQPNGTLSNAGQATSLLASDPYGNGYRTVRIDNGYSERDLSFTSCGGAAIVLGTRATSLSIEVPFPLDGSTHLASATIVGTFNYTYSFPANFGTWSIDDLNTGAHAPGGGWAFSFSPCP